MKSRQLSLRSALNLFRNEDEPLYKKAMIIPYWHIKSTNTIQIYLKQSVFAGGEGDSPQKKHMMKARAFTGLIKEREPSIFMTISRSLITDSGSFFPWED
jgi:hypothetical protein